MPQISLKLPDAQYQITIEPGLLAQAGKALRALSSSKNAVIVTDSHVAPLHALVLEESLREAGFATTVAIIPAGEQHKTLAMLMPVYDQLLSAKIERTTPLLSLGGGVVGDMAGFVAATILRGVPFVQIPTTLLAMVDASIGGKTGVDHAVGKNLIGAFHQPSAVLIDPQVLKTLPLPELRGGLAECIKHDLIRDANHFAQLPEMIDRCLHLQIDALTNLIAHNVAIKAAVVEADPFEHGVRSHLNFGHTFGHAIESVSNFAYSHGQAVSLGIAAAAYVSEKLALIDQPARISILSTLQRAQLPVNGLALNLDEVIRTMYFDKKVKAGKIRFVLLDGIGKCVLRDDVPENLIREALESLK